MPNLAAVVTQPDFDRLRPQLEAQSVDFGEFPQENGDVKIIFPAQHYTAVQALPDALPEEELSLPQQQPRQACLRKHTRTDILIVVSQNVI